MVLVLINLVSRVNSLKSIQVYHDSEEEIISKQK